MCCFFICCFACVLLGFALLPITLYYEIFMHLCLVDDKRACVEFCSVVDQNVLCGFWNNSIPLKVFALSTPGGRSQRACG